MAAIAEPVDIIVDSQSAEAVVRNACQGVIEAWGLHRRPARVVRAAAKRVARRAVDTGAERFWLRMRYAWPILTLELRAGEVTIIEHIDVTGTLLVAPDSSPEAIALEAVHAGRRVA